MQEHTVMWAAGSPNNAIKNHKNKSSLLFSTDSHCAAAAGWAASASAERFLFSVSSELSRHATT